MLKVFSQKYLEQPGFFPGCLRMIIEFPEIFQRKDAINNALKLADVIYETFYKTLKVTQKGYENSEEQYDSVNDASDQLRSTYVLMQENISQTQGVRIEWTESLEHMVDLVSKMSKRIAHTQGLIKELEGIQTIFDELGFQTNISSLNAIVNAAQTGEKGEIFAAVAEKTRKASDDIQNQIKIMLQKIKGINQSVSQAGELFTNLDRAMADFRKMSDKIISMSNRIVMFSKQQEEILEQISIIVKNAGQYTWKSRRRYKAISLKESDLKRFINNTFNILHTRKAFLGPYRLNKKVSLDNQRINIKNVESLVIGNQEIIIKELDALAVGEQEIGSISENLEAIDSAFQQVLSNAEESKKMMDMEIAGALDEISNQGHIFGEKITQITDFLKQVEKISFSMQSTILFNDMLPVVANMAALLVDDKTDLLFRAQELDELLIRLNQAADRIELFLKQANTEVFHISEMYKQMIFEMDNNRKTAVSIKKILENLLKNSMKQPMQIESVSSSSKVISDALKANRSCAESIIEEIEHLSESIKAYYSILDKRADHPVTN